KIARAMRGDVAILQSKVGEGSIFGARIGVKLKSGAKLYPSLHAARNATKARAGGAVKKPQRIDGTRILLVEDSSDVAMFMLTVLGHLGAKADVADNGHDAIEKAMKKPYDII